MLHNNLLAGSFVPATECPNRMEPIPKEDARTTFRKVDLGSNHAMFCEATSGIYVTGTDKLLKQYRYPGEEIDEVDFRKVPDDPEEELVSHAVGTTCQHESKEFKFFVTGGKDGSIIMRQINNISQMASNIKAHAVSSGGVTAICFS